MPASLSPRPAPASSAGPARTTSPRRAQVKLLAAALTVTVLSALAGMGTGLGTARAATTGFTFDTGTGLAFTVNGSNGDMTSLKHNGVELAAPGQAAAQFESGWSSATVTATMFDHDTAELITAAHDVVTQYFFARKGDNTIYLATNIAGPLNPDEARLISRLNSALLPQSLPAARTAGSTSAVEGTDVFRFADGTTASKFYSSQRLIAQHPFGASGPANGVFILPGNQEMSSGGPFFRDIEVNNTAAATNLTAYLYSHHAQTETLRLGLHGPYALAVTDGAAPTAKNLDFLSAYIPGTLSAAQRGMVTGRSIGSWNELPVTAALAGPTGEYWGSAQNGHFSIKGVRPGTYSATLYAGELAVGTTSNVVVTAGRKTSISLSGKVPAKGTLLQIGTFDGTPRGFRNADKIETMHPADPRMSPWTIAAFAGTATSNPSGFPMAIFKAVNSPLAVTFRLGSIPANGATLRIATTIAYAGGRPAVSIGGWHSSAADSPPPVNLDSRGVTRGTWRGVNQLYTFTIPKTAFRAGVNTLTITVVSGSSGVGFLSPSFVFDAVALNPTPAPATPDRSFPRRDRDPA